MFTRNVMFTRNKAIELFRQQWQDMQHDLGDNPSEFDRNLYKAIWCREHTPGYTIINACYLCEYTANNCKKCPIDWNDKNCYSGKVDYRTSPISEILALPERKIL